MGFTGGMQGMGGSQPGSTPIAAPQALGPKAAGKIRIGVAPPDAQVGQGNNAGGDYSTPIRNSIVLLMNGPAIEIAALDSHIAMQLQAEAQQKQCDYILYSSVAVKHSASGGFGKFMKMAAPVASMVPMAGMGSGMGGAMAAQAAGAAASAAAMSAQQQAMNQLAGFNGQIKQKDFPGRAGQGSARELTEGQGKVRRRRCADPTDPADCQRRADAGKQEVSGGMRQAQGREESSRALCLFIARGRLKPCPQCI